MALGRMDGALVLVGEDRGVLVRFTVAVRVAVTLDRVLGVLVRVGDDGVLLGTGVAGAARVAREIAVAI